MLRALCWIVVAALLGAAAYELALALGAGSIGPEPGDGVSGASAVSAVAALAILAGAVLGVVCTARPQAAVALFAPAAVAYLLAFVYTYDPYYAPSLHRYVDGNASPPWIALVVALAIGAAILTRWRPRAGSIATTLVLLVILVAVGLGGDGH